MIDAAEKDITSENPDETARRAAEQLAKAESIGEKMERQMAAEEAERVRKAQFGK